MFSQFTVSFNKLSEKFSNWIDQVVMMLPNFVVAVVLVLVFVLIAKLTRKLAMKTFRKVTDNEAVVNLMSNIAYIGVVTVGLFVALGVLQLEKTVTSLLAGVGVVGLALGFAFQTTAANFISGIFMAAKHPINVGDIVDTNGYFGTVDIIDMRFTKIMTPQGQAVIIPNKTILENPLVNYSITGSRRVDLQCGISYGDDLEKVQQVAVQCIEDNLKYMDGTEVDLIFTGYGDSSINFVLRFWLDFNSQGDFVKMQSEAVKLLKKAFDENDITIPFPIRTLDFGIKGGQTLHEMVPSLGQKN